MGCTSQTCTFILGTDWLSRYIITTHKLLFALFACMCVCLCVWAFEVKWGDTTGTMQAGHECNSLLQNTMLWFDLHRSAFLFFYSRSLSRLFRSTVHLVFLLHDTWWDYSKVKHGSLLQVLWASACVHAHDFYFQSVKRVSVEGTNHMGLRAVKRQKVLSVRSSAVTHTGRMSENERESLWDGEHVRHGCLWGGQKK